MADLFYSPRLTLARAKHHIRDFNQIVNTFINDNPWTYLVDKDSNPGCDVHKIKFLRQLPEELPCILFDITNNLRAVLDQSGYASAIAARSPSLKAVKFPFGPTEEKWRNNLSGGCKDLPSVIRSLFEGFKAYEGGNWALWSLNEIANTKKHCALMPLRIGNAQASFPAEVPDGTIIGHVIGPDGVAKGWDAEKREMKLVTVPTGLDPHITGNFTFSVAIQGIDAKSRTILTP
jgi:hypothetical protein